MPEMRATDLIFRSMFSKPATRLYPIERREPFPATRGRIVPYLQWCNSCTLCEMRCPTGAIRVDRDAKTWQIDRFRCILCGACATSCMKRCLAMDGAHAAPEQQKGVEVFSRPAELEPWVKNLVEKVRKVVEERGLEGQ